LEVKSWKRRFKSENDGFFSRDASERVERVFYSSSLSRELYLVRSFSNAKQRVSRKGSPRET